MHYNPTISAIIPAYNAEECVERAVECALNQTYQPIEVIVVDDGSTDDTASRVQKFGDSVVLVQQENGGPAAARNHGARIAKGDWLALLDADDAWLPERLERQLPYTTDESVGVVQCFDTGGSGLKAPEHITFDHLWERNCMGNSTALIRRTAFQAVSGFDEDRALICVEDYNLWLRLVAAGWKVVTHPECLVLYTPAEGNLSSQVERFARAELRNIELLARQLNLPGDIVEHKRLCVLEEYGIELLHHRHNRQARALLGSALADKPSIKRFSSWAATFLPVELLDLRRRIFRVQR